MTTIANKRLRVARVGGFTLIELILVIVILGILAAVALPKFANLSGDARMASLKAAKGAMASAAALAHAQSLVKPGDTSVTLEGVTVALTYGYPATGTDADAKKFAELAGISANDYYIETNKGELLVSPLGVSSANLANCFVTYTPPTAAGAAPRVSASQPNSSLNCN